MILITVELISARTGQRRTLGKSIICNDGSGDATRGHYRACFGRKGQDAHVSILDKPARESRVEDFPRLRLNVWYLLARSLKAAGYL